MRIVLSTEGFWPRIGGVEVIGAELVRSLRDRGHELTVVANREAEEAEEDFEGVRVLRRPFREVHETRDIEAVAAERRWMRELVAEVRPDVVHLFHIGPNVLYALEARRAHPAPIVVTLHFEPRPVLTREGTVVGRALREAAWVTTCARTSLADLLDQVPELEGRASALVNRLPPPAVAPSPLPFDPPALLMLGRVVNSHKGFDLGLSAFARVAASRDGLRLVVAGDGPDLGALRAQAAELGVAGRVDFLGMVGPGDKDGVIDAATAVVMPSFYEAYPLVALEAAQLARPVVAFDVSGVREIVRDGETGLLTAPGDVDALATALARLLDHPDETRALGRAALESLDGSWEELVDAYEAVYERVT